VVSHILRRAAAILAPALIVVAGSCDAIWGISPRTFDPNLVCDESGCRCAAGFGDCDGNQDNGCEADLQMAPETCGTCGTRCDHGTCSVGVCQCKTGFGDCDGDPSNGCETSIADNPLSCGACGHDCLGSPCNGSRCAPTLLAKLYGPTSLALDGGYLYFGACNAPAIQRIPIRGGKPEVVYSGQGCIRALAIDQGSLYFATKDQILAMKLDGSSPPSLVVDAPGVSEALGVVGGHVYWREDSDSIYLNRFSSTKGLEADLGHDNFPFHAISLTPKGAYWAGAEAIEYLPHTSKFAVEIAPVQSDLATGVPAFTIDAAHAYWAEPMSGAIKTVPLGGGAESVLTSATKPTSLFVDAASLYWTDAVTRDVRVVPLGAPNAASAVIATGQEIVNGTRIVGDEEAVYWFTVGAITGTTGNDTGKIWRATK
jgi:hypothetical protein